MSCEKVVVTQERDGIVVVEKIIERVTKVVSAGPQGIQGEKGEQGLPGEGMSPSEIKYNYEINPDTNAFTDSEKAKLATVEENATEGADWNINLENIPSDLAHQYTHHQITAAAIWTVIHNLNKKPTVAITDSAGEEVYGTITHIDNNQLQISFSAAFSGEAYLV